MLFTVISFIFRKAVLVCEGTEAMGGRGRWQIWPILRGFGLLDYSIQLIMTDLEFIICISKID